MGTKNSMIISIWRMLKSVSFLALLKLICFLLAGHAMWPALVLDGSLFGEHKGLNRNSGEKSVLVQFFGTHDFARCDIRMCDN